MAPKVKSKIVKKPVAKQDCKDDDEPSEQHVEEEQSIVTLPDGGTASQQVGEAPAPSWISIRRREQWDENLAQPSNQIGGNHEGSSAFVLFQEPGMDCAALELQPDGSQLAETNTMRKAIFYGVTSCEDGEVEFVVSKAGVERSSSEEARDESVRLSAGGEAMVPAGANYVITNLSKTHVARLFAIVPQN